MQVKCERSLLQNIPEETNVFAADRFATSRERLVLSGESLGFTTCVVVLYWGRQMIYSDARQLVYGKRRWLRRSASWFQVCPRGRPTHSL